MCPPNRIQVGCQRRPVTVGFYAGLSWRQPFDDVAGHAIPDERGPRADSDRRAAGEQNLLERERTVVVVCQVGAGPRAAGRLEKLLAAVAAVVNLNVPRKKFGQVLKQLGPVPVLGVKLRRRTRQGAVRPARDRWGSARG